MHSPIKLRVPISRFSPHRKQLHKEEKPTESERKLKPRVKAPTTTPTTETSRQKKHVSFVAYSRIDPECLVSKFSGKRKRGTTVASPRVEERKALSMPLVRIDMIRGARSPVEIRKVADTVQTVLEKDFKAPKHDRYQIITQHEPYELICDDTGLGYKRTNALLILTIAQQGRDATTKSQLYRSLAAALHEATGLRGEDLIVSCTENKQEDWSFGMGRAQFLDGGL